MTRALYKTTDDAGTRSRERRAVDHAAMAEASNRTTIADLLKRLGGVSAARVRLQPSPGTATERDVVAVHDRENRLFELVDGTLVEKVMGFDESRVDPAKRSVRVYTRRDQSTLLRENQTLDGGDVLPGFSLKIREWFRRAERSAPG